MLSFDNLFGITLSFTIKLNGTSLRDKNMIGKQRKGIKDIFEVKRYIGGCTQKKTQSSRINHRILALAFGKLSSNLFDF